MNERREEAVEIDVTAARINADAARLTDVVAERVRKTHRGLQFAEAPASKDDERVRHHEEKLALLTGELAVAEAMAEQVAQIRAAAAELQRLVIESRQLAEKDPFWLVPL